MAAPNPNENGETPTGTNEHPGVLSKLSNTIQAIKMPWNKDEQGAAPSAEDANPPTDNALAQNAADGTPGSNVFSATMSKVSNTFSNIQMPWTNKDQAPPVPPPGSEAPPPVASGPPGSDTNVLTDAFSKVTNTISNIQMPWTNKNEPQKSDAAPEPPADLTAAQAQAAGSDNVLTSTFSKVTNTFSNMQMPWSSKGDGGPAQQSPPTDGEQSQSLANGAGPAQPNETPLDKVTGFFTSVFKPGTAQPTDSTTENANAGTDAENSSKAQ